MKVLLIGSGGREHALAWRLAQSERCAALYAAPGNPGMEECADCVDIKADDIDGLVRFSSEKKIDLVVIGPEGPLVAGLADRVHAAGIKVFGPSAAAARLEGSKSFMKDICAQAGIPTAAYGRFSDSAKAAEFILRQKLPVVVKADGLAAGKGVIIAQTHEDAIKAAEDMLSGASFGAAGREVVIEEFLDGEELSYFALCDGETTVNLTSAQDHKRVYDNDEGPNTGGMGAYSPAHLMTPELEQKISARIIEPAAAAMKHAGCPFSGVLFAGIMVVAGEPHLLEFNARFGDPECQTLMMRLQGDLLDILEACAEGKLASVADQVRWSEDVSLCVVMAAKGYPGAYVRGAHIRNLEIADRKPGAKVFHAGTARDERGAVVSAGGRVLGVTARGVDVREARERAYEAISAIDWPEGFYRRDIAGRALAAVTQPIIKKNSTSC